MKYTKVLFGLELKEKLQKGVDLVADAVKLTLGAKGQNAILDNGAITITNDGVFIASRIIPQDEFEHTGAKVIKQVADNTNRIAGDGTTTSVVLTQALIREGLKQVKRPSSKWGFLLSLFNRKETKAGIEVKRDIEIATKEAIRLLDEISMPVDGIDQLKHVATISAESVPIGKLIAETIHKIGKDGVVLVEESQSTEISVTNIEGLQIDRGYASHNLVKNQKRMETEYRDCPVLIINKAIATQEEIIPIITQMIEKKIKEFVLIADEFSEGVIGMFVVNKYHDSFHVLPIKSPSFGDQRKEILEDIAVFTGATVMSDQKGTPLESFELSHLGSVDRVLATKDETLFVGGKYDKTIFDERLERMKNELAGLTDAWEISKLKARIAKMTGSIAILSVGAQTETEMKYLKLKIEDAVHATKNALAEGIVSGGGVTLAQIAKKLRAGGYSEIVSKALEQPLRQIAINAGDPDGAEILKQVQETGCGYNAKTRELVINMIDEGIIDPVKVTKTALLNASSASAIFLTTEVAVVDNYLDDVKK